MNRNLPTIKQEKALKTIPSMLSGDGERAAELLVRHFAAVIPQCEEGE